MYTTIIISLDCSCKAFTGKFLVGSEGGNLDEGGGNLDEGGGIWMRGGIWMGEGRGYI